MVEIEYVLCACGCGEKRPKHDNRGRERQYINGHASRGLVRSERTKQKISESKTGVPSPKRGRKLAGAALVAALKNIKKAQETIKDDNPAKWTSVREKHRQRMLGTHPSKEAIESMRRAANNRWKKQEERDKISATIKDKWESDNDYRDRVTNTQKERWRDMDKRIEMSCIMQGIPVDEWNGFTATASEQFTRSTAWKHVRAEVFKRDDYTCNQCGVRGGDMHAHHILQRKDYPELALDVDNCITLCVECHKQVHSVENGGNN